MHVQCTCVISWFKKFYIPVEERAKKNSGSGGRSEPHQRRSCLSSGSENGSFWNWGAYVKLLQLDSTESTRHCWRLCLRRYVLWLIGRLNGERSKWARKRGCSGQRRQRVNSSSRGAWRIASAVSDQRDAASRLTWRSSWRGSSARVGARGSSRDASANADRAVAPFVAEPPRRQVARASIERGQRTWRQRRSARQRRWRLWVQRPLAGCGPRGACCDASGWTARPPLFEHLGSRTAQRTRLIVAIKSVIRVLINKKIG